jgi:UDP-N-acetylglucosamine--dolichyl-phosphate N-acetylglucosaminephosphotransferase
MVLFLETLGLCKVERSKSGELVSCNNLTLINLILVKFGPLHESKLALYIVICQSLWSIAAFITRYFLVHIVYN